MHKHIEYREPYEDPDPDEPAPCPERFEITSSKKALLKGWIVDADKRQAILDRLADIALKDGTNDRNRLMAMKTILDCERVAQGWHDTDIRQQIADKTTGNQTQVNILAVAAELGGDDDDGIAGSPDDPELPASISD
jgi:hypothetical protein